MNESVIMLALMLLAAIVVVAVGGSVGTRKRRIQRFKREFGEEPDVKYESGDFDYIRQYYDMQRKNNQEKYTVDDITWNDVGLDDIFIDINATQTNCGEEYLFNMLHTPLFDEKDLNERRNAIDALKKDAPLRLKVQFALATLGRRRGIELCHNYKAGGARPSAVAWLFALDAITVGAIIYSFISPMSGILLLVLSIIVNANVNMVAKRKIENEFTRVNYMLGMVGTAKKLRKIDEPGINAYSKKLDGPLRKLGSLSHFSIVGGQMGNGINELIGSVLLLDLIAYEMCKWKVGANQNEFYKIFEVIGELDASVSLASYLKQKSSFCLPQIDFDSKTPFIDAKGLFHPQISDPVTNSVNTHRSMLITGSNASGKSTFLKTVALNAIFAQTIGICFAESYHASALRVYSSMALRDDIASGESYYIVEIKSIKRVLDALSGDTPVLCIVDEVLRGTNTVERIAASSEILYRMSDMGGLCIAATHDIELSVILNNVFDNFHFQEYIEDGKMAFDYTLHSGESTSRNAIKLLEIMGYGKQTVKSASDRAENFLKTGKWSYIHQ